MTEHRFGPLLDLMSRGERLCNEPRFSRNDDETVHHVEFEVLPRGDMQCKKCGEKFHNQGQQDEF